MTTDRDLRRWGDTVHMICPGSRDGVDRAVRRWVRSLGIRDARTERGHRWGESFPDGSDVWNVANADGVVLVTVEPRLTGVDRVLADLISQEGTPWIHLSVLRHGDQGGEVLSRFLRDLGSGRILVTGSDGERAGSYAVTLLERIMDRRARRGKAA